LPASLAHGRDPRLERRILREQIKAHLIERILSGSPAAGRPHPRTPTGSSAGVSQGPMREVLRHLDLLSFVASLLFRGT